MTDNPKYDNAVWELAYVTSLNYAFECYKQLEKEFDNIELAMSKGRELFILSRMKGMTETASNKQKQ